jgi:hypothetical protein
LVYSQVNLLILNQSLQRKNILLSTLLNINRCIQNDRSFADWWCKTMRRVKKEHKKGVNTLIILGAWTIWKHRNACVFEGANIILCELKDEHTLWCMAGAKKLQGLGCNTPHPG